MRITNQRALEQRHNQRTVYYGTNAMFFIPGAILLVIGGFIILVPGLFRVVFATALIAFGGFFIFVAWKLMQLRKKVQMAVKNLESQIVFRDVTIPTTEIIIEDEKITYH